MRTLAFLSAMTLLLAVADAQVERRKPLLPPLGPQLIAQQGKTETPLSITKADLRIVIDGYLAETTTTLTFSNPNDRVLEGELRFPLPEGATVSGFGLDVNGQLVDGVPVEKHQARITYETELRKGVDPGLMEHVAGNNYRTRIYPIPAHGTRTVRVQYVSELFATPDGLNYLLPLQWGQSIGEMNLKVEVLGSPEPKLTGATDMQATKADGRTIYQRAYRDVQFKDDLRVAIPGLPRQQVSVEKRIAEAGLQHYFLVSDLPNPDAVDIDRASPRSIAILWDASLSRAGADKDRELKLLAAFLKQCNGTQIEVVRFSNSAEKPRSFKINAADDGGLIQFLKDTAYDGATDLASLVIPQGVEYALLFSDGNGNLGPAMPATLPVPVYAISSDSRANHAILSAIGERSGGAYANLTRMDDAQALALLGRQPYALLSVKVDEGNVTDLVPSHPQPAIGRVVIAGKLTSPTAKLTLNYGHGTRIASSTTVALTQAGAAEGSLVPRAWAQRRIAELAVEEQKNHDAILALAREFGVVTPNTSLLVLETLEQYLQYKITPPKTREEMYATYQKRIGEQKKQEQKQAADKIEQVAKMWNERVAWWEKSYTYPANFKYIAPPAAKDSPAPLGAVSGRGGFGGGAAAANGGNHPTPVETAAPAPGIHPADPARPSTPAASNTTLYRLSSGVTRNGAAASDSLALPDAQKDGKESDTVTATISIKPWNPETPYLIKLRLAKPRDAYNVYLKERAGSASPAFYLDCANFFIEKNQRDIGIRILTNIAELELDSPALLRVAAYRLVQIGEYDLAIDLFEKVLRLRPEEPQSHRDLALALIARSDKASLNSAVPTIDDERALSLLHHVVMHDYDRFPGIEVIALMEANRLLSKMPPQTGANPFDKRLVKLLDCEARIVLTWDSDLTDMDLWVTEPSGELCMYNHNRTTIGGMISNDFTQGYGPEEYCIRKAMKGQYKIQANFYGSRQQSLSGPTTLQAEIITNFGRPNEKRQAITLRLEKAKDVVDVGTITIE